MESGDKIAETTEQISNGAIDNILEESTAAEDTTPSRPSAKAPEMFTIHHVCELISLHYDRAFKHLRFSPPAQIIDGAVAKFVDEELNATVATCRVRLRNILQINKTTGDMHIEVHLSDVTFQRGSVDLSIGSPNP